MSPVRHEPHHLLNRYIHIPQTKKKKEEEEEEKVEQEPMICSVAGLMTGMRRLERGERHCPSMKRLRVGMVIAITMGCFVVPSDGDGSNGAVERCNKRGNGK